jgi:hypothetical protein
MTLNGIRGALSDSKLQTPALKQWSERLMAISTHRSILGGLFLLGIIRGLSLYLAYPPAHGADSTVYFFYAEWLNGYNILHITDLAPPLYPILISITFKWLGSIYWLVALQLLMSAALAPIYYQMLKPYNPILAVAVALVILGDVQVGVVFNFISTEPLYLFLLAVSLFVFVRQVDSKNPDRRLDAGAGMLLVTLLLTRAVGRYLIIPLALVFLLRTRSWKRTLTFVAGFAITLGVFSLLMILLTGQTTSVSASNYMGINVITKNEGLVRRENGPYTSRYLDIAHNCDMKIYACLEQQTGGWSNALSLIVNLGLETFSANWQQYTAKVWNNTQNFLSMSGQQLGFDPELPSDVQCRDIDARIGQVTAEQLRQHTTWGWILGDYSEAKLAEVRQIQRTFREAMCPPLPNSPLARKIVDYLAFRYRSLGRPQPFLWYGTLFILAFAVPRARRYLTVVLAAGVFLLNHALISAVLSNIQPRYIVVTNPFRVVLLGLLLSIVCGVAVYLLDWLLARRTPVPAPSQAVP